MKDFIQKVKELNKLLTQIEKLLIRVISIIGWLSILINLFN